MNLEVGKNYLSKEGKTIKIFYRKNGGKYPYWGIDIQKNTRYSYADDGKNMSKPERDLAEEIIPKRKISDWINGITK